MEITSFLCMSQALAILAWSCAGACGVQDPGAFHPQLTPLVHCLPLLTQVPYCHPCSSAHGNGKKGPVHHFLLEQVLEVTFIPSAHPISHNVVTWSLSTPEEPEN